MKTLMIGSVMVMVIVCIFMPIKAESGQFTRTMLYDNMSQFMNISGGHS